MMSSYYTTSKLKF